MRDVDTTGWPCNHNGYWTHSDPCTDCVAKWARAYLTPVPLVYAPDIVAATRWETDDELARALASMTPERRARFIVLASGKVSP